MNAEKSFGGSLENVTFSKNQVTVNVKTPHSSHGNTDSVVARLKEKRWRLLTTSGVAAVILIIIVLMSLPVVFFYLPRIEKRNIINGTSSCVVLVENKIMCEEVIAYTEDDCRDELLSLMECFPNSFVSDSGDIFIGAEPSMSQRKLLSAFKEFGSPECVAAATPFLCVYLFGGLCDGNGTHYLPTASECVQISTGICQRDWELARSFGMEIVDCGLLPHNTSDMNFNSSIVAGENGSATGSNTMQSCTPSCRENFICQNQSCFPQCPEWSLLPSAVSKFMDRATLTLAPMGLTAGAVVLVISCLRRKKVYVFPSVLIVYQTISLLIYILFHLITHFDRSSLYCTSRNLLESIADSTSFCVVAGIAAQYFILQINLWWAFHMAALFWKVHFPVHALTLQSTMRLRVVHVVCVLLALLLPVIPDIATIVDAVIQESNSDQSVPGTLGFGFVLFPPLLCFSLNTNVIFYTIIFPSILLIIFKTVMLILTIWKIHKTQGLFHSSPKLSKSIVSTAEKKLLVVFCYYILLEVIGYVSFTLDIQVSGSLQTEFSSYFLCEQTGHNSSNPCSRSKLENLLNSEISILAHSLTMLTPFVNFVFVVDYSELKQKIKQFRQKEVITQQTL